MALPNATKTNYGNVDDITPTEMNDIGSNLISLGQKILKVVDDTWILTNADHDGVNFIRIDIARAATGLQIGIDGTQTYWRVAAGANPISWIEVFAIDSAGVQTIGTVPFGRIANVLSQTTSTLTNTFSLGNLSAGTFIQLTCKGTSVIPGTPGNPHSYFNLINTGTAIFRTQGVQSLQVNPSLTYSLNISSIIEVTATSSISVDAIISQGTTPINTITAIIYN